MNKTQTTTLIIYGIVLLATAASSRATVFSVIETIFVWPGILGFIIGIIALVKGNMLGWGIHNRRVAIIVIVVSFAYSMIMSYIFTFLPLFFY